MRLYCAMRIRSNKNWVDGLRSKAIPSKGCSETVVSLSSCDVDAMMLVSLLDRGALIRLRFGRLRLLMNQNNVFTDKVNR